MRRILLTNDDGVHARGLLVARRVLSQLGEVVVVAPDREMSGVSHGLTLNHPLRLRALDDRTYVVNGTPTDCVILALYRLLDRRPDLVVSGINRGFNLGYDVSYSGTVAGAMEGALNEIPAMAVSLDAAGDLEGAPVDQVVGALAAWMLETDRRGLLLNVNIPAGEIQGIRITRQGLAGFRSKVIEKQDPRGDGYYWIGGHHAHEREERSETDLQTVRSGLVSVTPLTLDLTSESAFRTLRTEGDIERIPGR